MKKKRFLFSLLMAIVMMAMSPQKMWATADVTWSLGGAYEDDPASGVWVGSSEGGGEQIKSGHLYLCFTPAGTDSQLNNWITQLTFLSSNSGLDGACVDAMNEFLAANSQWNGYNADNANFSANCFRQTGGAFGTPISIGQYSASPVTIDGIDVNTAYNVLAIIFDTEEITADSKYVVIKGYGAKDWYMESYTGLLEIGFASEWNDGDIDRGNAAPNNAVDGKWHAVGDRSLTAHPAAAATCTTAGYSSDCWSCSACGKYFSDAEGKNVIAASSVVIPANHDDVRYDAANQKTYCESCGTTLATGTWIFLDGVNITIATDYDNTGDIMFSNGTMIVKEGATITHGVAVNAGGVLINYGSINMAAYNGGGTIYNHGYIKNYINYSGENYNTGTYSSLEYPEKNLTTCSHTNMTPLGTVEATCTKPGGSLYECSTCYYRFVPEGSQIAALGHDLPAYDNGFATCNRCGEEIMQEPQSQDGILKIANLGNLYWFLEKLEKEPDTYNSAHLELTNDIVVNDGTFDTDGNFTATNASTTSTPRAWRKCVENDRTFYGTVDGQGHEIKGLYFNDSQSYVYLFYDLGATDNKTATITNLGFTNVYCSAKNPPLFCHYNYGTISQCYVNGTIEGNGWSPTAFCYYNYGTISQCYTTGIRKNKDYPSASLCYHNYGTVTNSYSTCNLFGSETYGLIADNYGTITNCYFAGTLSATTNYGLCGIFKSGSSSTNCYTTYPTAYDSSNSAVHPTINTSVSAERLASGEIAYLLNGSQDAGTWRQKLSGEDVNTSPVLKQTDDNKVYYGYTDCAATEKTYANSALHATQGHNFTNYTYNNDATCVKNGTMTASCDNGCGTTDTKDDPEYPATGHSITNYIYNNDATCVKNGTKTASCDNGCGTTDTKDDPEHPATGHTFTNYTYNNDVTCVKSGTKTASCDNGCGTTDTKDDPEYPATGNHEYTENSNGFCTVCGGYQPATLVNSVYEISNAGQLYWFANQANTVNLGIHGKLTKDITVNDGTFDENGKFTKTGETVESTPISWTPIGGAYNGSYYDGGYTGTFDGENHTISGLYWDMITRRNVGLFGNASGGSIKKLGVINSFMRGISEVGILCGYSNCTIENCYTSGIVRGTYQPNGPITAYLENIGGLCGSNGGSLTNCHSSCTVISDCQYTGGLCGYNAGTLNGCYATGNVTSTKEYTGGLCGGSKNCSASYISCYATGKVTSTSSIVGGLCGGLQYYDKMIQVLNCYASGNIEAPNTHVGGLVGSILAPPGDDNTVTIKNCYSTGNIKAGQYHGGLFGDILAGTVVNCYTNTSAEIGIGSYRYTVLTNVSTKPLSAFQSGEITYLLNGSRNEGTDESPLVWGQVLEADATPTLNGNGVDTYKRTNIKNKWGTLVVPFDVLADQEEYDLYSIIRVEDEELTLKRPEGILPAGTPVLIRMSEAGKDAETGKYILYLEAANTALNTTITNPAAVDGYTLKGSYDVAEVADNDYIISNNAFWKASGLKDNDNLWKDKDGNTMASDKRHVYCSPFRAYLASSTSNNAKMLSIGWNDDEDITAVETLDALTSDEAQYYDINGRKLNDLQQGINIVKRGNKTYKIIVK